MMLTSNCTTFFVKRVKVIRDQFSRAQDLKSNRGASQKNLTSCNVLLQMQEGSFCCQAGLKWQLNIILDRNVNVHAKSFHCVYTG